jgi:hypothetical protein
MDDVLIACADIGSVRNDNFGWYANDGSHGCKPSELAEHLAEALADGRPVALGFECPLFIPLPVDEHDLGKRRNGEGNRPWSAGAGCGALATGLAQTTWILNRVLARCGPQQWKAHLDWSDFAKARCGLLVWEAFVTGTAKGHSHVDDAKSAVEAFNARLPAPYTDVTVDNAISLAGLALLRAGWRLDVQSLSQGCIVIKTHQR